MSLYNLQPKAFYNSTTNIYGIGGDWRNGVGGD